MPRVLIVDDSASMRAFVRAALEEPGLGSEQLEVVEAASGFDALRLLPRGPYALVITDINMPDINGLELVRFIRDSETHKRTPLIIISTDGREADRDRGMKLGANAYLTKPFEPEQLLKIVRSLLK